MNINSNESQLIGLVLSGGKSSRMGSDKGLLKIKDRLWVEYMYQKMEAIGVPYFISINNRQVKKYSERINTDKLIIDCYPQIGPMGGILSAHDRFPLKDILVTPCDLINLDPTLLQKLIKVKNQKATAEIYMYKSSISIEPLCAIYTSVSLKKIKSNLTGGSLTSFSLKKATKTLGVEYLSSGNDKLSFRNYNTTESILDIEPSLSDFEKS